MISERDIGLFIGSRVRERRLKLGWTLENVCEKLSVSHQQLQKYERGKTRVSASGLLKISKILGVSIDYFYNGYDKFQPKQRPQDFVDGSSRQNPLNLLVVENDSADMMLIHKAILDANELVNIYVLNSGIQTLDLLKKRNLTDRFPRPDLIFMEFSLPQINGFQVLREIKRDRDIQDIPIVIFSNSLDKKDLVKCYKNYAGGYILKVFDSREFQSQIKNALVYWSTVFLPHM
jgi:hypothetical protein